jgi:hypothetical protein
MDVVLAEEHPGENAGTEAPGELAEAGGRRAGSEGVGGSKAAGAAGEAGGDDEEDGGKEEDGGGGDPEEVLGPFEAVAQEAGQCPTAQGEEGGEGRHP